MSKSTIVRAWKDAQYRASLAPDQRAAIGSHPAGEGLGEIDETELRGIADGIRQSFMRPTTSLYPDTLIFQCC